MALLERTFLAFEMDGRRFTVASEDVRRVVAWRRPTALPGARGWVEGLLVWHGEAVPVLSLGYWDAANETAEAFVLVTCRGRELAIACRFPVLQKAGAPTSDGDEEHDGGAPGEEAWRGGGSSRGDLDVEKLYLALGLH